MKSGLPTASGCRGVRPITLAEAAKRLAEQTGRDEARCRSQLQAMLILMSRPAHERGGDGDRAFLAFKLHRFISGAGHVYATLRSAPQRRVTLDGQRFDPGRSGSAALRDLLLPQLRPGASPGRSRRRRRDHARLPRDIDETPLDDPDSAEKPGYLMPEPENDDDYSFTGALEDYPEEWLEIEPRRRVTAAQRPPAYARAGAHRRCERRGRHHRTPSVVPSWQISLLPGLQGSAGGAGPRDQQAGGPVGRRPQLRDDAAGVQRAAMDEYAAAARCRPSRRKLLGFTDNRQDAALQAGHFNDFLFVALLRAATLAAVRAAGPDGLTEDEFGRRLQAALGFHGGQSRAAAGMDARSRDQRRWLRSEAERTLARVLAHRVWVDQRRGWRFTNPNLEELGLVRAEYVSLDELAADDGAFANAPPELRTASTRQRAAKRSVDLLDHLRHGLAITADALDPATSRRSANAARQNLREPWSISQQESPAVAAALIIDAPKTRRGRPARRAADRPRRPAQPAGAPAWTRQHLGQAAR